MKNSEIVKMAEEVSKKLGLDPNGDFFIGSKVDEVLPNGKISTLVCVDCSWLRDRRGQTAILDHKDLDEIDDGYKNPSIKIDIEDIVITKWFDAVDSDGDIHHCKVESFITMSEDPFNPVEGTDWALFIEL